MFCNAIAHAVDSQTYPPVEASSGEEQHCITSSLHLFAHFMFSCCRGKSNIGMHEILPIEHWEIYVDWLFCCCCDCCCCICNCGCTMTDEQKQQKQNYTKQEE